jgi:endoglucanase
MTAEYKGVNLSGLEFGSKAGHTLWWHYAFSGEKHYDYWAEEVGANVVRLPFIWERLQTEPEGDLVQNYLDLLLEAADMAEERGMTLILDMHNYGRYFYEGQSHKIGEGAITVDHLSNVWTQLAAYFNGRDNVWLNLMNEPFGFDAQDWADISQTVVTDLRQDGITNKILLSGTKWSGAHSWVASGNAAAYEDFVDPLDNYAFDVHQYLDTYSTGTTGVFKDGYGATALMQVTNWAREQGEKLFLGEFGASDASVAGQDNADEEIDALLNFIDDNSDVWLGWSAWGAGEWWNENYHFNLNADGLGTDDVSHNAIVDYLLEHFDFATPQDNTEQNEPVPDQQGNQDAPDAPDESENGQILPEGNYAQADKDAMGSDKVDNTFNISARINDTPVSRYAVEEAQGLQNGQAYLLTGTVNTKDIYLLDNHAQGFVIGDFEVAHDTLDISAFGELDFDDVLTLAREEGSHVVLDFGTTEVLLEEIGLNDLQNHHFIYDDYALAG